MNEKETNCQFDEELDEVFYTDEDINDVLDEDGYDDYDLDDEPLSDEEIQKFKLYIKKLKENAAKRKQQTDNSADNNGQVNL